MFGGLGEVAGLVAEPFPETTAKLITGMFGVLGEVAELVAETFPETKAKRLRTDISPDSFLPNIFRFDLIRQKQNKRQSTFFSFQYFLRSSKSTR